MDLLAPFVSVIIPVYNDHSRLTICLHALEAQTYPRDRYEIIVVDNGSDKSIQPIVAQFSHSKAAAEARPGSYAARNTGISLARGDILAFTDSDCTPAPDWLEKGVKNLLSIQNGGIVGGRIDVFLKDPDRPTAVEFYDKIMYYNMRMFIEKMNFSGAGNLFTFKHVFDRVGHFDEDLKSGGDREWGQRVASFGYLLFYADDVCVTHPPRSSFEELRQREIRIAGGCEDLSRKYAIRINRYFFLSFLPPLISVIRLGQQVNTKEKIKIILIWFALKYVKAKERLRIKLRKGKSIR
jgi:glycosyltransferase involved in cell wall biosynthesis